MKMLRRAALQNKEYDLRCQKHFLFVVLILLTNFSLYNTNNNHHLSVQISQKSMHYNQRLIYILLCLNSAQPL